MDAAAAAAAAAAPAAAAPAAAAPAAAVVVDCLTLKQTRDFFR